MLTGRPQPPATILIVADVTRMRGVWQQLEAQGLSAVSATTAADAYRVAGTSGPDLALVDAHTREIDGLSTARTLRGEHGLPVVLLSTPDAHDDVTRATADAPFPTLVAPWSDHHLRTVIHIVLGTERATRERLHAEAHRREQTQRLSHLEAAHTDLVEKTAALEAALIEAHAAVEAKAAFLATMSHEIRTPMNGMIGMASLLRESEPLTAEQLDYIETIRMSGETLLTIVNNVLDFSKVESGHMELECIPFDLRRCVAETVQPLAPRAREKQIDLAVEIDPSVPDAIIGDALRLRQVLANLVGNAVKFTDAGGVVVRVHAEPWADGQHRLHVQVSDTGIGIPDDKHDRLFRSFSQVDSSTSRVYGGTGLGLAISQRFVKLMGGTIEVQSIPGSGSMFSFGIVVRGAPAVEHDRALSFPRPQCAIRLTLDEASPGTRPRILVAEDNPVNRRVATAMLERLGHRADTVRNGIEVVRACRETAYDLVFMDVQMPELDGLEATRRVRALPGRRPVIVAMTAHAMDGDREACLAVGMDDYVSKPMRLDDMRRVLALTSPSSSTR